jgi:hypothetical protein
MNIICETIYLVPDRLSNIIIWIFLNRVIVGGYFIELICVSLRGRKSSYKRKSTLLAIQE